MIVVFMILNHNIWIVESSNNNIIYFSDYSQASKRGVDAAFSHTFPIIKFAVQQPMLSIVSSIVQITV